MAQIRKGSKEKVSTKPLDKQLLAQIKIAQELERKLGISCKKQEHMKEELNRNLNMMEHHCAEVERNTGEITMEDISYCIDLTLRVMKYKFNIKD